MATTNTPNSYKDPYWSTLSTNTEQKLNLPEGLLKSILINGEKSNADQVSEAGARTPYQIIPATRNAVIKKYGIDAYLSPENSAEVAGLLLKESLDRNKGDIRQAITEYVGGTNPANYGPITKKYTQRVAFGVPSLQAQEQEQEQGQGQEPRKRIGLPPPTPDTGSIANVFKAYTDGRMSEQDAKEFETDVQSGRVMLPRGSKLKITQAAGAPPVRGEPILLPQGVTNAYVGNQMSPQDRKDLEDDIRAGIVKLPPTVGQTIPTEPGVPLPTEQGIIDRPPTPTLLQNIVGAGETGLALGTGVTGGSVGLIGGLVGEVANQILSDNKLTPTQSRRAIEDAAVKASQALTYAPRTATGQEMTQATGEFLQKALPPIPAVTAPGALMTSASQLARPAQIVGRAGVLKAADVAVQAGEAIAAPVVKAVETIKGVVSPSAPKTVGASVGAAATPEALRRVTISENLPVPFTMTRGAATKDAAQLAFEKEMIKNPSLGQPFRDRAEENNTQALQNFDALVDMTDAKAADISATGTAVSRALSDGYAGAKRQTRAAFAEARKAPEANNAVDLRTPVTIGSGDLEVVGTLTDYLNSKVSGVPSSAVTDTAKKILIKQGLAIEDSQGNLTGVPATVGKMEDFRKEISGIAKFDDATGLRDETIIKKIVDALTEPVAGPLFKKARLTRQQQAVKFENRAIVSRLIQNRKGMDDPKVAVDQVFNKTILGGSPEEITFIKRILNISGEDGKQAWKELQGATVQHIKYEATKGVGSASDGSPLVSPAKLNQVINQLDKNGRLDIIFDKKTAGIMRDINSTVKDIMTVPPGTLINSSGTVGTLLAALGEVGLGSTVGVPLPVLSGIKFIKKMRAENATKAKIADALNALPIIPPTP